MTTPTFQELMTSQEARFTNEQLEAWAGLGPWRQERMHTGGFDIFNPADRDIVTLYGGGIGQDKIGPYAALIAAAPALAAALLAERKAREVEQKELERYKAFIFEPNYLETSAAKAIRNCALGPSDDDGHLYLYDLIPEEWCSPNRLVASDEMAERLADVAIGQWIVDARQALKGQRDE